MIIKYTKTILHIMVSVGVSFFYLGILKYANIHLGYTNNTRFTHAHTRGVKTDVFQTETVPLLKSGLEGDSSDEIVDTSGTIAFRVETLAATFLISHPLCRSI